MPTRASENVLLLFPAAREPKSSRRETWLTRFGDEWERVVGGEPTWGQFASVLGKLKDKHGADRVFLHFQCYLSHLEQSGNQRFASIKRFSETFGLYAPSLSRGSQSVSRNQAALQQYRQLKSARSV